MAAVGCAVIEAVTQPGFLPRVTQAGHHLAGNLQRLARRHGCGEVRGKGLLLALDLKRDVAPRVADLARLRGLLVNAPRADSLRFMPATHGQRRGDRPDDRHPRRRAGGGRSDTSPRRHRNYKTRGTAYPAWRA